MNVRRYKKIIVEQVKGRAKEWFVGAVVQMIEWSHPELSLNPGHHLPTQRKAKMKKKEAGMARIERDRYQLTGLWRINMKT